MKLVSCPYGHYYDPAKYHSCPHCEVADHDDDVGYTVARQSQPEAAPYVDHAAGHEAPAGAAVRHDDADDQATRGIAQKEFGLDPVTGWLVCVSGNARGTDYRIHTERNTLGRSEKMDICIKGDLGISRESHAVISYNPRARHFTLIPGDGKSIIYLNGQEILSPTQLSSYDRIEISETVLVFMPLCSEYFSWDDESNQ